MTTLPQTSAVEVERAFFDGLVGAEGDFNPFADRGWATLARAFRELAAPAPGSNLLDVGCGTGRSRQIYQEFTGCYTGIDLSEGALAKARINFPSDRWMVANACAMPFPDASFDVVAFSSVLHHIDDFPTAVREGARVLKPGGVAFAFDPNVFNPAIGTFRHPRSPLYNPQGVSPNERPLRPAVLRKAFADAGLSDLRQRCQADLPYRSVAPPLLNSLLFLHNAGDWMLARTGLANWLGTFVVTVGRKPA